MIRSLSLICLTIYVSFEDDTNECMLFIHISFDITPSNISVGIFRINKLLVANKFF